MKKLIAQLGFDEKTFFRFVLIVSNAQLIYAFSNLKSVLYDPLLDALGVSNTQFGILLGIVGFLGCFGGGTIGWLQDRFSIRTVLGVNSLLYGTWALIMSIWPECPFSLKCLFYTGIGLNGDALYWATILKSVRTLAKEDRQGTAFGMLESGRGICQFIVTGLAVVVYTALGSTREGMQLVMIGCSVVTLLSGVSILVFFPKEMHAEVEEPKKTKTAFSGFLKVLRMPEVWMTGTSAACVYAVNCGIGMYSLPYLNDVFLLPVSLVAVYGLVNGSATRIISSPFAGIIADYKFKSTSHMMRISYVGILIFLVASLLCPKKTSMVLPAMILMLAVVIFTYFIRGVYYAPIGELGIPTEISAAAMAVAACIGYSPSFWSYPLFGFLIDYFPGEKGYSLIFMVSIGFAILGIVLTTLLGRRTVARRKALAAENS